MLKTNEPMVSIITPVFNGEAYLADSIDSVLNQSYENWELILVDDGSEDSSVSIALRYARLDKRIHLYELGENQGVVSARNFGLSRSIGNYISFLDADDKWLPFKLDTQINIMMKYKYPIVYSDYHVIDSEGTRLKTRRCQPTTRYEDLLYGNTIGMLTAIYDKSLVGEASFRSVGHEDFDFWLRLLSKRIIAYGITEPLAEYRVHGKSLSSSKFLAAKKTWENLTLGENLSFHIAAYYFFHYAVNAIRKRV